MKTFTLCVIASLLYGSALWAQTVEPFPRHRVDEIQRSAIGAVQSLEDVLHLLGSNGISAAEKSQIRANLQQHTFSSDRVMLANDLDTRSSQELRVNEYLRKLSDRTDWDLRYEGYEASPIGFDDMRGQYVMFVKVERTLNWQGRENRQTLYYFLENLKSVPLIYGSATDQPRPDIEVPILEGDWWVIEPAVAAPVYGPDPESSSTSRVSRGSDCEVIESQVSDYIRKMVHSSVEEIGPSDLIRMNSLEQELDRQCTRRHSRPLQQTLKTLSKDVVSAIEAEVVANQLTQELLQQEMAHLSRRELSQYLRQVRKAGEDLNPRIIRRPKHLIERKAEEYQTLSKWHASAVRHPHINLKASLSSAMFLTEEAIRQDPDAYRALYQNLFSMQIGWRRNRLRKAPRTPDPQTGKRKLKRAHVITAFYQQTIAGVDPFGYRGSYNPYQIRSTQFQELELGVVWWEWLRTSGGTGLQWGGQIGEEVLRQYYTATAAISFRALKIFEFDLGCNSLWEPSFPQPTLRPFASAGILLKL